MRQLVNLFLAYKANVVNCSVKSVNLYAHYLGAFIDRLNDEPPTAEALEEWLAAMKLRGVSDSARSSAFRITRTFARWAALKGYMRDFTEGLRGPIVRDRKPPCPPRGEVLRLIEAVRASGRMHAARDAAILAVLYYAGLRIGEALTLTLDDIDLEGRSLRVLGKGGKLREVPISAQLGVELEDWLAVRKRGARLLFYAQARHRETFGQLDGPRFARALRQIYWPVSGLSSRFTAHALRRASATRMSRRGAPLPVIQDFLGHSSPKTTMRYIRVSPQDLRRWTEKL